MKKRLRDMGNNYQNEQNNHNSVIPGSCSCKFFSVEEEKYFIQKVREWGVTNISKIKYRLMSNMNVQKNIFAFFSISTEQDSLNK